MDEPRCRELWQSLQPQQSHNCFHRRTVRQEVPAECSVPFFLSNSSWLCARRAALCSGRLSKRLARVFADRLAPYRDHLWALNFPQPHTLVSFPSREPTLLVTGGWRQLLCGLHHCVPWPCREVFYRLRLSSRGWHRA